MTLIVATAERIYIDTRITLKDKLTDGFGQQHTLEFSTDGIGKLMECGVRTSGSGAIYHTAGYGDLRTFKALNGILKAVGLDSFIEAIGSIADLMSSCKYSSGLVWVDEEGLINVIAREPHGLSYEQYVDGVRAFGHSTQLFDYLNSFESIPVEEAFLLACAECAYSSDGDYLIYDVKERTYHHCKLEPEQLEACLRLIRCKIANELAGVGAAELSEPGHQLSHWSNG